MTKALKPIIPLGNATPGDVSRGVKFTSENGFTQTGAGRVDWICTPDKQHIIKAKEQAVSVPDLTAAPGDIRAGRIAYTKTGFTTGTLMASDYISISFYDWDDSLLGTRFIEKNSSLIDPNTTENKAIYLNEDGTSKYTDVELAQMNVAPIIPYGNPLGTMPGNRNPVTVIYNKAGYEHAGWVDFSGTSTPDVVSTAEAGQTIEGNGQTLIPLTNLTEHLILRAASNEVGVSTIQRDRRYILDYTKFKYTNDHSMLYTEIYMCRPPSCRRAEAGKRLKLYLRPTGTGEYPFSFNMGDLDFEIFRLELPTFSNINLSANNALGLSFISNAGVIIGNGLSIRADEIVDSETIIQP